MSRTLMSAGRVTAAYVDDGQGRRLVLADMNRTGYALDRVLVVATHQGEVRELIATLKQLAEELPPAPAAPAAAMSTRDILTLAEVP